MPAACCCPPGTRRLQTAAYNLMTSFNAQDLGTGKNLNRMLVSRWKQLRAGDGLTSFLKQQYVGMHIRSINMK